MAHDPALAVCRLS